MPTGTVIRFDAKRGFGFIKCDDDELFVHQNDIKMEGFRSLYLEEEVEFEIEENDKGMKALNVKVVRESPRRSGPPTRYNPRNNGSRSRQSDGSKTEAMLNRLLDVLAEDSGDVEAILNREDLNYIRNG